MSAGNAGKDSLSGYNIYKISSDFDVASEKQVQPIKNVPEKLNDIQRNEISSVPSFDNSVEKAGNLYLNQKSPRKMRFSKIGLNPKSAENERWY